MVCLKLFLVIFKIKLILDIYEDFVYPGCEYNSVPFLSKNVPILSCGGLTKKFMMPGLRLGNLIIPHNLNKFI